MMIRHPRLTDIQVTETRDHLRALASHHGSAMAVAKALDVSAASIHGVLSGDTRPGRKLADIARTALERATSPSIPTRAPQRPTPPTRPTAPRVVVAMPAKGAASEPTLIDRMLEELTARKGELSVRQHTIASELAEINRAINALLPASKAAAS